MARSAKPLSSADVEHRQGQRMHGGGKGDRPAVGQHGAKRRCPVRGERGGEGGGEARGGGLLRLAGFRFLLVGFFAVTSSGRTRPRVTASLPR